MALSRDSADVTTDGWNTQFDPDKFNWAMLDDQLLFPGDATVGDQGGGLPTMGSGSEDASLTALLLGDTSGGSVPGPPRRIDSGTSSGVSSGGVKQEADSGVAVTGVFQPQQQHHQARPGKDAGKLSGIEVISRQLEKQREKTRTTQKRYRERQKSKLQQSEEQAAKLTEQLRQLSTKKESLASRNALLEQMLAVQQQDRQAAEPVEGQPTAADDCAFSSNDDVWWLDEHTQQLLDEMIGSGDIVISVNEARPYTLTCEQVAAMPIEEHAAIWKRYISEFGVCLVQARGDESSPAGQRLVSLLHEAFRFKKVMARHALSRMHDFKQRMEEILMQDARAAGPVDYAAMVRVAALQPEQKRVLLALRRMFLTNLGALAARRRRLSDAIAQVSNPGIDATRDNFHEYITKTAADMDAMRRTLRDEHSYLTQFVMSVWGRCLKPFQNATLMFHMFPRNLDTCAFINELASEEGEPDGGDLMRTGAAGDCGVLLPLDTMVGLLPVVAGDSPKN